MAIIPLDFSVLFITLSNYDIVDEVLILLAEFWKMFLNSPNLPITHEIYYNKVFDKILH